MPVCNDKRKVVTLKMIDNDDDGHDYDDNDDEWVPGLPVSTDKRKVGMVVMMTVIKIID